MREDTCRLPGFGKRPMQIDYNLNRPGCRVSHCGLTLEDTLEETAWRDIGKVLGRIASSQQWWIGDWWAFVSTGMVLEAPWSMPRTGRGRRCRRA